MSYYISEKDKEVIIELTEDLNIRVYKIILNSPSELNKDSVIVPKMKLGRPSRNRSDNDLQTGKMIDMLKKGKFAIDIANKLGVNINTVYQMKSRLKKEGAISEPEKSQELPAPNPKTNDIRSKIIAMIDEGKNSNEISIELNVSLELVNDVFSNRFNY